MGMESFDAPAREQERPELSANQEREIRDKIEKLRNASQRLIDEENNIRAHTPGPDDDPYKRGKIDIVVRQRLAIDQEIDQLNRRLTSSDLETTEE